MYFIKGIMKGMVMFCLFIEGEYMIEIDITEAEISGNINVGS